MKTYLVGYSVIHSAGNSVSRAFISSDGPVNYLTLMRWEQTIRADYNQELKNVSIRIFSFQEL